MGYGLQAAKNLYSYGHIGIVTTTGFVRDHVFRIDQIILARRAGDSFFKEFAVPAGSRDLATLRAKIIEALGLPEDALLTIVKDGDVLIDRDADVERLRARDKLEVTVVGIDPNYRAPASESSELHASLDDSIIPLETVPLQQPQEPQAWASLAARDP